MNYYCKSCGVEISEEEDFFLEGLCDCCASPSYWPPKQEEPAWDKCERCGERLVCHCGSYAEEHTQADNHAFSPMPCPPCRTEVKP